MHIEIAKPKDASVLLEIYKPYILKTAVTYEVEVPSVEAFEKRIETTLKRYPYLMAKQGEEIIGYAYAGTFIGRSACDWSVEVSVYIKETARRSGAGRMLYQALENLLKRQGIVNMNAAVAYPRQEDEYLNLDSVRFHEKLGFRIVGRFDCCGYKFGKWFDLIWMEKHIGDHQTSMSPFIPFSALKAEKLQSIGDLKNQ